MTAAVKICGIRDAETARVAVEAGADYIGLVFYEQSPRHVTITEALAVAAAVDGKAKLVGLFVDKEESALEEIAQAVKLDMLQFHGRETVEQLRAAKRFGSEIAKVIPVREASDLEAVDAYTNVADWLIFDTKPPRDATRPGGNGAAFDWTLLAGKDWQRPWMLSGGLNPGNVQEAIRITGAKTVDVSSGVEDRPGIKNHDLIRQFIAAAKEKL